MIINEMVIYGIAKDNKIYFANYDNSAFIADDGQAIPNPDGNPMGWSFDGIAIAAWCDLEEWCEMRVPQSFMFQEKKFINDGSNYYYDDSEEEMELSKVEQLSFQIQIISWTLLSI